MIKVNYDATTGKVLSFGKDTEPYIEITEAERKQPLPTKYHYYAVVDGQFKILARTPSPTETKNDTARALLIIKLESLWRAGVPLTNTPSVKQTAQSGARK